MTSFNNSLLNETTLTEEKILDCPEYNNETEKIIDQFAFWSEGVLLCVLGFPGILGNALSSYILAGKSMRNSFNLLLIGKHKSKVTNRKIRKIEFIDICGSKNVSSSSTVNTGES